MASISTSKRNGRRRLMFNGADGNRRTVNLGKMPSKQADAVKLRVEHLVSSQITRHSPDDETARWIAALPDALRRKLAAVGLPVGPARSTHSLADLLDEFDRYDAGNVKPSTRTAHGHTRRNLLAHFAPTRQARTISPLDAEKFRQSLALRLASATVSKRVKVARQIFKQAVRWGMADSNPFADVRGGSQTNRDRMHFITPDDTARVIEACPDVQWRLIVALARYAGLRVPSEVLALTWADVLWDRNRLRIIEGKTGERSVPLFLELVPHLHDAFDLAEPGTTHVITRYRQANANLRTQFQRIIRRARLVPWPKPFHNLRSTRQTELAERWPLHVVCRWLGNSPAVANDHYLQLTDADFDRAAGVQEATQNPTRNPTQQGAVRLGTSRQPFDRVRENPSKCRGVPLGAELCRTEKWPPRDSNPHALAGSGF